VKKSTLILVALSFFSATAFAGLPFGAKGDFIAVTLDGKQHTINKTDVAYIAMDSGDDMKIYFKGSPTLNPLVLDFDDKPLLKKQVYKALVGSNLKTITSKKSKKKK
jgi:hypothetical protein